MMDIIFLILIHNPFKFTKSYIYLIKNEYWWILLNMRIMQIYETVICHCKLKSDILNFKNEHIYI